MTTDLLRSPGVMRGRTQRAASSVVSDMTGIRASALLILVLGASPAWGEREPEWEVSVAGQGGLAGEMMGFGAVAHALWTPSRYWAAGGLVDVMYLSGGGDLAGTRATYQVALLSTYVAGVGQLRLPLGAWMPFLELGLGGVVVSRLENLNNQCSENSGVSPSVAGGLEVRLSDNLALGARGGGRLSSAGRSCTLIANGPASMGPDFVLLSASAGVHVRW